jgi:hypothetical protein
MKRIGSAVRFNVATTATLLSRAPRVEAVLFALMLACAREGLPVPGAGPAGGGPAGAGMSPRPDGPMPLDPKTERGPDAAPDLPPATSALSCAELQRQGHGDTLITFDWQVQRQPCPSSACVDFVSIDGLCAARLQRKDVARSTTLAPALCAQIRSLVTADPFLRVLETGQGCAPGQVEEAFEVTAAGRMYRRKTFSCSEPALDGVRACVSEMLQPLFP